MRPVNCGPCSDSNAPVNVTSSEITSSTHEFCHDMCSSLAFVPVVSTPDFTPPSQSAAHHHHHHHHQQQQHAEQSDTVTSADFIADPAATRQLHPPAAVTTTIHDDPLLADQGDEGRLMYGVQQQVSAATGGSGGGGPVCAACRTVIGDRYYLAALGVAWHVGCLSCQHCLRPLDAQLTCFVRDGKIYCREDYYRLFAPQLCSRCLSPVSAHELVMYARQQVYHVDCFVCAVCERRLLTGQHFGMYRNTIYCQTHYEMVVGSPATDFGDQFDSSLSTSMTPDHPGGGQHHHHLQQQQQPPSGVDAGSSLSPPPAYTVLEGQPQSLPVTAHTPPDHTRRAMPPSLSSPYYNGTGATHKGRPRKRCKIPLSECSPPSDGDPFAATNFGDVSFSEIVGCDLELLRHGGSAAYSRIKDGGPGGCGRQKRLRTSFKHHQLRSMKAYFALNHNPDAKDLKELAQKTGLTKRVLQVWFQNARAKYRRNTLKQEQQERSGNSGSGNNNNTHIHQVAAADSATASLGLDKVSQSDRIGSSVTSPNGIGIHRSSGGSIRPRQGHTPGRGQTRSPASLSDLSSTPSSTTDLHGHAAGLMLMDMDHRGGGIQDSLAMFGGSFLADNCQ